MKTTKICIAGKNNIAVDMLCHALKFFDATDVIVLTNKTDTGCDSWQKSLLKAARDKDIRIGELSDLYEMDELVFLSLEYDKLIKPELFSSKKLFNIHFSLLPKYKGHFTSAWPILNGEVKSGVTLHYIDDGIDTGPVVAQQAFEIDHNDTARDLYLKYLKFGTELVVSHFNRIIENDLIDSKVQPTIGASFYSVKSIDYNNIFIDTNKTANEIHNQLRAYTFREYQLPKLLGQSVTYSKIQSQKSTLNPGEILVETDYTLEIATVDNNLLVYKDVYPAVLECCRQGDINALKECSAYLLNIDTKNKLGWTPLMVAVYHKHIEVVKFLVESGAGVNEVNYKGTTVSMYTRNRVSMDSDSLAILRFLHYSGADFRVSDNTGKSLVDYFRDDKNEMFMDFFRQIGVL